MDPEEATRSRRAVSPKAPGLSLGEAMREVTRAYDRYGHGQFSKGELASALGMAATGGAFASKYATLNEYALLDDGAGRLRISDLYMTLKAAAPGSVESRTAAMAAIQSSGAFAKLLGQFTTRVPDVDGIALRLESQERFNPERAKTVAEAFRGSLTEFGLTDGIGNLLTVEHAAFDRLDVTSVRERLAETSVSRDDQFKVEVPLSGGRRALLFLPEALEAADVRRIAAILHAYVQDESAS